MREHLSIDRPPLFTARHRENWVIHREALKRLGVERALGRSEGIIEIFDRADENERLSIDEEDRLSRAIERLSDLWARWTESERAEFYDLFLDHARQPHFTRPYEEAEIYIPDHPPGMAEMKRRGWTPHPYQARAVQFALENPRVILALEMGLGKTLIALMSYHLLRSRGDIQRALIVAPKSAHGSWREHLELSAASICVLTSQSPDKREALYTRLYHGDLDGVLVTPQTLALDYGYFAKLLQREPYLLISDEAHRFKAQTSRSGLSYADLSQRAERVIALTGTPKPNKIEDFYHLVERTKPNTLGRLQDFISRYTYRRFASMDTIRGPQYEMGALRGDMLGELYERLRNTLFTRHTSDPDAKIDLPPRKDLAPYIAPDENQRTLMKLMVEAQAAKELNASIYRESLEGKHGFIAQIAAEGAPETAQALGMRLEQATISPSLFSETFGQHHPNYESPKLKWIIDMVMSYLREDQTHAAVIFCEYLIGLTEARKALIRRGLKSSEIDIYTGDSSESQRADMIHRLNAGGSRVLLGQTRALETGANLQKRAAMVAHLSTPWAPDTLTQSTARVYRQGQKRPVIVLRPSGSRLEEAKNKALTRKIMQSASLTGALTDADRAVIQTSADERIRRAHARLIERGSYDLDIIRTLVKEDMT
jgi:SNF2 family DNA or RNA helicase